MKIKVVAVLARRAALWLLASALGLCLTNAVAQNSAFTYQGRVTDSGTNFTGNGRFKFALVTVPASNSYVTFWSNDGTSVNGSEPANAVLVPVTNGLFTVAVGDTNLPNMAGIDASLFTQPNLKLRIWFSDGVNSFAALDPAQALTPAPYAAFANTASNLPVSAQLNVVGLTIQNVPGGTPNLIGGSSANYVGSFIAGATIAGGGQPGLSNSVTAGFGTVSGGDANSINSGEYATVSGGHGSTVAGYFATVGGGYSNNIQFNAYGATIGGGEMNSISNAAFLSTIAGGYGNNIDSPWATIGGGGYNAIGTNCNSDTVSGGFGNQIADNTHDSTIGGGSFGSIGTYSFGSTIAGGSHNSIGTNSVESTIAGGVYNSIEGTNVSVATIGGGTNNTASALGATVAGGIQNTASAWGSTVGGGGYNTASSPDGSATVSGGYGNQATGDSSSVGGGDGNVASGSYATIPGGDGNFAFGRFSFAAGLFAEAATDGSFVWADATGNIFTTTGPNQFLVRAAGGVGINTEAPVGTLSINTGHGTLTVRNDGPVPGLLAGSDTPFPGHMRLRDHLEVWPSDTGSEDGYVDIRGTNGNPNITLDGQSGNITCVSLNQTSDRNAKADCSPIDDGKVLAKVAALPISEWVYKTDAGARHIGPMAQDFHAAFGLNGSDDRHITTVDEGGVALAAIQGLNRKLDAENAELKQQVLELKAVVSQLKQRLDSTGSNR